MLGGGLHSPSALVSDYCCLLMCIIHLFMVVVCCVKYKVNFLFHSIVHSEMYFLKIGGNTDRKSAIVLSFSNPVNIRNVFKWFKCLQNVFKTLLNPILWFSKRFQVNIYIVMFKKRFRNIL